MANRGAGRTRNPVVFLYIDLLAFSWSSLVRNRRLRLRIANWLPPPSCVFHSCYVVFKLFVSKSLSGVPVN